MTVRRRQRSTGGDRPPPPPLTRHERSEIGAALRDALHALLPVAEEQDDGALWDLLVLLTELHDVACPGGKYAYLSPDERADARTVRTSLLYDED